MREKIEEKQDEEGFENQLTLRAKCLLD